MAIDERLERYARLAVEVGLNLQPGQRLGVGCMVEHAPFAQAVAAVAYEAGASYVDVVYADQHVRRAHIEHAAEADLGWSPPWHVARFHDFAADGSAYLAVRGNPEPELYAGLDGKRIAGARQRELDEARLSLSGGASNWSVVAYPTAGWAQTVFGEPDLERLWAAVTTAVRLDEPDPVAAWQEHLAVLEQRAALLNERAFDALRYRGPGTDLSVGLLAESRWRGGLEEAHGIRHVPNMPTEEVFTTPDARRVSGTVTATYPLQLDGTIVRGLKVGFAEGRAVEVSADQGEELIRSHIARDEGASRLGEVALVDVGSRVGRTGLVFCDTLFDENAACHIAFGSSIPSSVRGPTLAPEQRSARGINVSSIHTDFMIGSAELDVDGVTPVGEPVAIIRDGAFLLA